MTEKMKAKQTEGTLTCSLSSTELARRSAEISKLIEGSLEWRQLPDRFAVSFPGDEQTARRLLDFILAERRCCSFLSFGLAFEPEMGFIQLTFGGSQEARDFLQQMAVAAGVNQ